MVREKMSRNNRAKQFLPFDAMKGLKEAIHLKEYEHEKITMGELSEEKANEISSLLSSLKKGDYVFVTYFEDGYYHKMEGKCVLDIYNNAITVEKKELSLSQIYDIKKLSL